VLGDRVVAAVAAQGQADGAEAIRAALRANPRIRTVLAWNDLIQAYLGGRGNLARVYLLVDARHGLKETDENQTGTFLIFEAAAAGGSGR